MKLQVVDLIGKLRNIVEEDTGNCQEKYRSMSINSSGVEHDLRDLYIWLELMLLSQSGRMPSCC